MSHFSLFGVRPRRLFRVALLMFLPLGFLGVSAAWGWSAYHVSAARREADAEQLTSAWQHLERARLTWPLGADAHVLAARVARRLGQTDRARAHLEAHEKLGGASHDRALEQTLLLVQEGDLDGSEMDLLHLVQDNHPQSGCILEALARGSLKKNRPAGLPRLLRLWSDRLATSCWRGKVHYRLGHFSEAVADLTPFVAQDPDWDELRFELAQACHRAGRAAECLMHLRHLQRRNPSSPDVLLALGISLQDQSLFDEAATVLDRLLEQDPNHPAGLVERGRVAFRQGQPQQGERWARQVVDRYPTVPDAYLVLALCLEAQGDKLEAQKQQQRWQALDAAQYHLSQMLPQLGLSPDDAQLHFQAGSILLTLRKQEMALEALGQALRLDPNHRPTHRLLAEYYAGLGQLDLAKKHQQAAAP